MKWLPAVCLTVAFTACGGEKSSRPGDSVNVPPAVTTATTSPGRPPRLALATTVGTSLTKADTLIPRFSILSDTVLYVSGSTIRVRGCGTSKVFMRLWRGAKTTLVADTVLVSIPCAVVTPAPAPAHAPVAAVDVGLSTPKWPPDYGLPPRASTVTFNLAQLPAAQPHSASDTALLAVSSARFDTTVAPGAVDSIWYAFDRLVYPAKLAKRRTRR